MIGARVLGNAARGVLAALRNGFALVGLVAVCAGALVALDGDAYRRALLSPDGAAAAVGAAVLASRVAA